MTLLRIYPKNGVHKPANATDETRFSDLMKDFFDKDLATRYNSPDVNVIEEDKEFRLQLAVPGIKKSDIRIDLEKDELIIAHEKEAGKDEAEVCYTRREFDYGKFKKTFNLPDSVDTEKVNASMENGILTVRLPKKDEAIDKGPKEIKIS